MVVEARRGVDCLVTATECKPSRASLACLIAGIPIITAQGLEDSTALCNRQLPTGGAFPIL
jgi:hypothetical protein